jgi:L-malate glycosyltransferase
MGGIHQFVPALLPGDATGQHTLEIRRLVQEMGLESEIYAEAVHPDLEGEGRHFTDYPRRRAHGDLLLYQMAAASVLADFLYVRPEPLAVDYHNITPPEFFRPWDPETASAQIWSRAQALRLASRAVLGIGDSAFNEADLVEMGYGATTVVPILVDWQAFEVSVDDDALGHLLQTKSGGGADWLFVGRLVPNKAQHDLVKAFSAYRDLYDSSARLHLVGRTSVRRYGQALRRFVGELGLDGAVEFAEGVTQAELAAHYQAADVLVSCSDHEGFCVPLLEAMHHGVPVVAYAAAAVPETLGQAGILLGDKSGLEVAAAVHRVLSDSELRGRLIAAGRRRLSDFGLEATRRRMRQALETLLSSS